MVVVRSDPRTCTTVASWLFVLATHWAPSLKQPLLLLRLRSLPGSQFSDTPMPLLLNVPWSWVLEHPLSVFEHPHARYPEDFLALGPRTPPMPSALKTSCSQSSSETSWLSVLRQPNALSPWTPMLSVIANLWLSAFIQTHAPSARKPSGSQPSITPMLSVLEHLLALNSWICTGTQTTVSVVIHWMLFRSFFSGTLWLAVLLNPLAVGSQATFAWLSYNTHPSLIEHSLAACPPGCVNVLHLSTFVGSTWSISCFRPSNFLSMIVQYSHSNAWT